MCCEKVSHELRYDTIDDLHWKTDIGPGIRGFLLLVHCNHTSILHRYGDMKASNLRLTHVIDQKVTANAPCHVTCKQGVRNDHMFGIP